MQIFYNDVLAIDVNVHAVWVGRGRKRGGKLSLVSQSYEVVEGVDKTFEVLKNLSKSVKKDEEDIVVASLPMENVLMVNLKVPRTVTSKMVKDYAVIEVARNLGILPEQLQVALFSRYEDNGLFFVSKKDQVKDFVNKLKLSGFPEADVVVPDVVKYLEVFEYYTRKEKLTSALLVICSFLNDYYAILTLREGSYTSCRLIFSSFWDYLYVVQDTRGIPIGEMLTGNVRENLSFLEPYFLDFLAELDREAKLSLDEAKLSMLDRQYHLIDLHFFSDVYKSVAGKYEGTVLKRGIVLETGGKVPCGLLGLLMRGGRELGKVKSLSL